MKKSNFSTMAILSLFLLIFTSIVLLSSCNDDDDNTFEAPESKKDINITNHPKLGNILTDKTGMTLYFFTPDINRPTICVEGCVIAWPVFYQENATIGFGLTKSDFGVVTRADGKKQSTYKGWPLYFYQGDKSPGEVKGEALENAWFVAKPDYTIMIGHGQLIGEDGISYGKDYKPGQNRFTAYFTDDRGNALYTFTKDTDKKNTYTSETDQTKNAVWPIFKSVKKVILPSLLKIADFESITVFKDSQITFKGHPIYNFGRDKGFGDTKGVSVPLPGVWPVATTIGIEIELPSK